MLSLHTNAAALSTQNALGHNNKSLTSSMTKLGTGFRINSSQDDAAGLQIATRLNSQSSGMKVAQKNTQNAISLLQTADGALSEIANMAVRMKDLATELANGTNSSDDETALKGEMTQLAKQMGEIYTKTSFAGKKIFGNGTDGFLTEDATNGIQFQVGAESGEIYKFKPTALTLNTAKDGFWNEAGTPAVITPGMDVLKTFINSVGTLRSEIGAAANRLEHTYNNLGNMITNTETAKGRIMDVDYAAETSNMTKNQMLMQASSAMLKQSNSMSQMVSSLLQ